MTTTLINHFSDTLCIWAYVAHVRVKELHEQLADQVRIDHHFIDVFGSTDKKIGIGWNDRGGFDAYADHVAPIAHGRPARVVFAPPGARPLCCASRRSRSVVMPT